MHYWRIFRRPLDPPVAREVQPQAEESEHQSLTIKAQQAQAKFCLRAKVKRYNIVK